VGKKKKWKGFFRLRSVLKVVKLTGLSRVEKCGNTDALPNRMGKGGDLTQGSKEMMGSRSHIAKIRPKRETWSLRKTRKERGW